jgi:hypothetical protein
MGFEVKLSKGLEFCNIVLLLHTAVFIAIDALLDPYSSTLWAWVAHVFSFLSKPLLDPKTHLLTAKDSTCLDPKHVPDGRDRLLRPSLCATFVQC